MCTHIDATIIIKALRNLMNTDATQYDNTVTRNFNTVVRMFSRPTVNCAITECIRNVPSIDGNGVCQFALSMFIVLYNIQISRRRQAGYVLASVEVHNDVFDTMCQSTKARMESVYNLMRSDPSSPHFVCCNQDVSNILTTMRGLNPMIERTDITGRGSMNRDNCVNNTVLWMTGAMNIYMSFESTLGMWTLYAAKTLLQCVDLALCVDDQAILDRVRSPQYVDRWEKLLAAMQDYVMVNNNEACRVKDLQVHNIDALFATMLHKHSNNHTFWKKVVYWDNDVLPLWCSSALHVPRPVHGTRRKRVDPFECVIVRRADHWIVQTQTTYELVPDLIHATAAWADQMRFISRSELTICGVDDSIQILIDTITLD
jgi:hypothetical protein